MSKRPAPDDGLDPHDAKRNANLTSVGAAIRVWRNFRGGSFKEEDVRGDRFTTLGGYNIFKNTDSKPPPKPKYYYDSEEEEEAKEELRQRTQLKKDRQEAWLNSGLAWNASLGDGYTGVKVLGAGSFGIAGLWALKNTEANKTLVKHIVVKQTNSYKRNVIRMREEARIMQLFQGSGSRHIVKLYSGPFVEKAEGQANPFPPPAMMGGGYPDQRKKEDDGEAQLARIFIEYCEAGNMTSFIKLMRKKYSAENPMPEEKIWLIFDCLASGIAVMENGNENIEGASWDREICHMDIKPDNIFIQNEDDQHPNSIFKFGDFGVSCEALPYDQQSIEWMKCQFFTPDYESPEQAEVNRGSKYSNYDDEDAFYGIDPSTGKPKTQYANTYDPALKYGSHTNVWAVGKVMYNLINRGASFDNDAPEYEFELSPGDGIVTQGQAIISAPYSATLRKTVMRCLAVDWQDRPMTRDLLDTIDRAILAIQRSRAGSAGAGPGAGPHPEPTDDDPNSNFDSSSVSHGGAGGEGGEGGGGESADQGSQFSVERVEHFVDATGKIVTDLTEDSVEGSRSSMSKATGVIDLTEE